MSLSPNSLVRVHGRVGRVLSVQPRGDGVSLVTVYHEGEAPRTYLHPTTRIEPIAGPLERMEAGGLDSPLRCDLYNLALRLSLAYNYDHLVSLSNSRTNLEYYQVECLHRVMQSPKQRFLIADDVGLGKTVEAGMVLKELSARRRAGRALVVVPAFLAPQWLREMQEKFGERFVIYDRLKLDVLRSELGIHANPWKAHDRIITSIDLVKRDEPLNGKPAILPQVLEVDWDLVIFDEAHRLSSAKYAGGKKTEVKSSKRYQAAEQIAPRAHSLLLLSATPHKGDPFAFYQIVRLLDPYRFPDEDAIRPERLTDLMVRRGKEGLVSEKGEPIFKGRCVAALPLAFTDEEKRLYDAVTSYTREGWNRSRRLAPGQRNPVGFAMVVLQKRMVSSIEAIRLSLERRLERLEGMRESLLDMHEQLEELRESKGRGVVLSLSAEDIERLYPGDPIELGDEDIYDGEELDPEEAEEIESILELVTDAHDPEELEKEIAELEALVALAESVTADSKSEHLLQFLRETIARDPSEKVLVFTEYTDTLQFLAGLLGEAGIRYTTIHGGLDLEARKAREAEFASEGCSVLLATDAAGEGLNFQFCHIQVNYELPWNPTRIDQRIGRLHRYGQTRTVTVHNLLVTNTLEGEIFERLMEKVSQIEADLGGRTAEVIGQLLEAVQFENLIMGALAEEKPVQVTAKQLELALEKRREMIERVSNDFVMKFQQFDLSQAMETVSANEKRTVHLGYIQLLVRNFFDLYGGKVENTKRRNVYRLLVPPVIQDGRRITDKLPFGTFEKATARARGNEDVEFLAFGHPLVDRIVAFCIEPGSELGGRAGLRIVLGETTQGREGYLLTFKLTYGDGRGNRTTEELLPVFVTGDGEADLFTGRRIAALEPFSGPLSPAPPPPLALTPRDAFARAEALAMSHVAAAEETVRKRKDREYGILRRDAEAYFRGRREPLDKRLVDYRARVTTDDMTIAIRSVEAELDKLRHEEQARMEDLETDRQILVEAPELVSVERVV